MWVGVGVGARSGRGDTEGGCFVLEAISLSLWRGKMKKWGSEYGLVRQGIGEAVPGHTEFSPVFVSQHLTWYVCLL